MNVPSRVSAAQAGSRTGETERWSPARLYLNLAGVLSGVVALGFAIRPEWARAGALLKGAFYVAVTTSLLVVDARTLWLGSNWADQTIHASLAVGGIATGLATPHSRIAEGAE